MSSIFILIYFILFFKDFIYLFDRDRHSERGNTSRRSGRGRSRLPIEQGARCGGLIPGPSDPDLSQRQTLNH